MPVDREHAHALVRGVAERGLVIGDGRRPVTTRGTHTHRDPATGRPVVDVPVAGADDVDDAVAAARDALPAWRALSPHRRAALLHRLADLLEADRADAAALTAVDNGTPVSALDPGRATADLGPLLRRVGRQARGPGRPRRLAASTTSSPSPTAWSPPSSRGTAR